MPKEEILKVSGLFSDICAVSQKWDKEDKEAKEKLAKQKSIETNVTDKKVGDTGGDNNVDTKNDGKDKDVPTKDKQGNSSQE